VTPATRSLSLPLPIRSLIVRTTLCGDWKATYIFTCETRRIIRVPCSATTANYHQRATNIPEILSKGSRLRIRDTPLFPGSRLPGLCLRNQRHLSCGSRHHRRRLGRPINYLLLRINQRDSIQEGHEMMRALPGMGEDQMA